MSSDPTKETIAVYDQLGVVYADQIAGVRIPILEEFMGMLSTRARVLDVGCAAGRDSAIFRDAGFRVVGVDLSTSLLAIARERVRGVELQYMDARHLSFPDESFDAVYAHAMLLNLPRADVPLALKCFWKALKHGGCCLVAVKEGLGEKFVGEALVNGLKRHETYFTLLEMEQLLRDAGFSILKSVVSGDSLGRSPVTWVCVFAKK